MTPGGPNVPYQVDNPTSEERHEMLKYLLDINNRPEDYKNILEVLSPPPDILTLCPKGCGRNTRVAVIGAGEAGLSSAFELRKTGCDITILEASNRIGGRIFTYYFDEDKRYYGDLGAMRLGIAHEITWHYINLFKLETSPFATTNVNGFNYIRDARARNDPEGISVMRNIYPRFNLTPEEKATPWQELADRINKKYINALSPDIRKELIQIKPVYSEPIVHIDSLSYRRAYESVGLSQDAISMLGFLVTFDESFFNLGLVEILRDSYTQDFQMNYRINGGMINLPNAFYDALSDKIEGVYGPVSREDLGNVSFKLNTAVDGIYLAPGAKGIMLDCRNIYKDEHFYEKFDYVICTIPFSSLRRVNIQPLFGVQKMQAIRELNYTPGQKILMFLKDRFWEMGPPGKRIVGGSSSTDLPNISVFYPSDHAQPVPGKLNEWNLKPGTSPYEPGVLLASYNWAQDALRLGNENCDVKLQDIKRYIEEIHGLPSSYLDSRLLSWVSLYWDQVQYIWGSLCLAKPEDKTLFSYVITQPEFNERVFFAGEHISQKHGWQQGALQTAMAAANEVAKRINRRNK